MHKNSFKDPGYHSFIMDYLRIATPYIKPGGAILDFGSGPQPVPAALLSGLGFEVTIYDPFFAPETRWNTRLWDAIMVHEVAEHVQEPGTIFSSLAKMLVPGGVLCVRTRFLPEKREAFQNWHYRTDPTHVGFFSARSITALANRLGLGILRLEEPDRIILAKR